jgi:uncharacterized protein (TIGR00369 family)
MRESRRHTALSDAPGPDGLRVDSQRLNAVSVGTLAGLFGVEIEQLVPKRIWGRMLVRPEFLAPNGYLHAASIMALADTVCGYGTVANLPDGAVNFTTIEFKSNFLGTAREGVLKCEAVMLHGGRTTQVWDAQVATETDGKVIAAVRCTQLVLYPRGAA